MYTLNLYCHFVGGHDFELSRERAHKLLRHAYRTDQLQREVSERGSRMYRILTTGTGCAFLSIKRGA